MWRARRLGWFAGLWRLRGIWNLDVLDLGVRIGHLIALVFVQDAVVILVVFVGLVDFAMSSPFDCYRWLDQLRSSRRATLLELCQLVNFIICS